MSKVIGVIPARWASTRFPGKSLHEIAGKPLIRHVWERCSEAACFEKIIIATDDIRIAKTASDFGAEAVMTSPDHTSGTDRIAEVAQKLKKAAYIFNIQGDEPLIEPVLLERLVRQIEESRRTDIITAATLIDWEEAANENSVKVVCNRRGEALYFSRSVIPFPRSTSSLRPYKHLGVYGFKRSALLCFVSIPPGNLERAEQLEQLRALENGLTIRVVVCDSASVGVDTPEDAIEVERLILNRSNR
ncbi:MAG: 3-deoxy-manno-octulosonate cytidylyltransferase [Verrucomicrobia bacterium]|nr:3-deoxy-manno-octulosonate cytidylyltransferase [Verrucomicrobiota bacterium]